MATQGPRAARLAHRDGRVRRGQAAHAGDRVAQRAAGAGAGHTRRLLTPARLHEEVHGELATSLGSRIAAGNKVSWVDIGKTSWLGFDDCNCLLDFIVPINVSFYQNQKL